MLRSRPYSALALEPSYVGPNDDSDVEPRSVGPAVRDGSR